MTKVRGVTGGGIDGKNVSNVNAPKQEPKPHAVSVGAVSRLGGMVGVGTPYKNIYNAVGYTTPLGTKQVVGADCKPGGGRMVMRAGSQSTTPSPRPMGKGRDLFKWERRSWLMLIGCGSCVVS
jgi:hypothetical protein